jgi:uncharacterized delta-60 repeat protein
MRSSGRSPAAAFIPLVLGGLALAAPVRPARAAGELDPTFGTNGIVATSLPPLRRGGGSAIVVQPDGAIVVAGQSVDPTDTTGTTNQGLLVRYTGGGTLDASFGSGGIVETPLGTDGSGLSGLVLQPDGKLVAAGIANDAGGDPNRNQGALARYLADGSLDPDFGTGGILRPALGSVGGAFFDLVQGPGETLVAAGRGYNGGNSLAFGVVARYLVDGSPDATFGSGGIAVVHGEEHVSFNGLVRQPDGKLLATASGFVGGVNGCLVARLEADGALDTAFGTGGITHAPITGGTLYCLDVDLQSDGKIVVSGGIFAGLDADAVLVRFLASGQPDPSFGTDGVLRTTASDAVLGGEMLVQPDDKIVVVGIMRTGGAIGRFDFLMLRHLADGTLDPDFDGDGIVKTEVGSGGYGLSAVARQPDAKLVAVGGPYVLRYFGEGSPPSTVTTSTTSSLPPSTSGSTSTSHSTSTSSSTSSSTSTTTSICAIVSAAFLRAVVI